MGSTLAVALRREFEDVRIVVLDNLRRRGSELALERLRTEGIAFIHGDIRAKEDFSALPQCEFLIDCSAEPSVLAGYTTDPDYVINTNLIGSCNTLAYARRAGCRVLFLSTSRVYPIARLNEADYEELPTRFQWTASEPASGISAAGVTEDCPLDGHRSIYGATKLASELLLTEYQHAFGVDHVIDRCGVLAGPWQMGKIDQGIVAFWTLNHTLQRPLRYIGFGGKGKQVRDILHVDDLCRLVIEQIRHFDCFSGGTFNVGGGPDRTVSLCELTELCRNATSRTTEIAATEVDRPADVRIYISDNARIAALTSWRPRLSVEQTVDDVSKWMTDNLDRLRPVLT